MSDHIEQTTLLEKYNNLPLNIRTSYILCFNNWEEPEDFYDMSLHERQELAKKYKPMAVPPTKENQWIWFGSYDVKKKFPKLSGYSVSRLLYTNFIGEPEGYLTNNKFVCKSDVNPFKLLISGGRMSDYFKIRSSIDTTPDIDKCLVQIEELYVPDIGINSETIIPVLQARGFRRNTIIEALKKFEPLAHEVSDA